MKKTTVKMTDYLSNMLLPGLGFRTTRNNKHLASYFYLMAAIIAALGVLYKRDLWSVAFYLAIGVLASLILFIQVKEEEKKNLEQKTINLNTNEIEQVVSREKAAGKVHAGMIILILIIMPMLFSFVYTNTPEGTNWWKESREAKTYLTKRYGDHFTIERVEFMRPMLGFNVVSVVYFHPNESPGRHFEANRAIGGEFADTYVSDALEADIGKDLAPLIKDAFGNDVVYYLWSAPSDDLRQNYNPAHKGSFSEYIAEFAKDYKAGESGRHLDTEIRMIRFVDYETTDLNLESARVIKLGRELSRRIPVTCAPGLKIQYIPPKYKNEAMKIIHAKGFDFNDHLLTEPLYRYANYYNNSVVLYPDEKPSKQTLVDETHPVIH